MDIAFRFDQARITSQALHYVGLKADEEAMIVSPTLLEADDHTESLLMKYFLSAFKSQELFHLGYNTVPEDNPVLSAVSRIFSRPDTLLEESVKLAEHLYDCSEHPSIKSGDFFVVHFEDCILEGEITDAIGLFKAEQISHFLKVLRANNSMDVRSESGIDVNKLDKGCIIFNIDAENGYVAAQVDRTNPGNEAAYWSKEFLRLKNRNDAYHHTSKAMELCKEFISVEMPDRFHVTPADQADLLNRTAQFFREHDTFGVQEFASEVMEDPQVIDEFTRYKSEFENDRQVSVDDGFDISAPAFKKQARIFKSVIKLDKNFHIYVHGNREMIERGVEPDGRKYYKVYFDEER